jgi:hypothetical protein
MRSKLSPLVLVALLTALPSVAAAERGTLVATLSGAPAGDPDGAGRAQITVDTARLRLCYAITATGIAPASGAGIHRGSPTDNARPVIRLVAPADGESRSCVEVSSYDAHEMLRRPESFYVSVRNDEHPTGALRGQLAK